MATLRHPVLTCLSICIHKLTCRTPFSSRIRVRNASAGQIRTRVSGNLGSYFEYPVHLDIVGVRGWPKGKDSQLPKTDTMRDVELLNSFAFSQLRPKFENALLTAEV